MPTFTKREPEKLLAGLSARITSMLRELLVSRLRNSFTEAHDAREDVIGAFGPDKRLRLLVIDVQILANGAL